MGGFGHDEVGSRLASAIFTILNQSGPQATSSSLDALRALSTIDKGESLYEAVGEVSRMVLELAENDVRSGGQSGVSRIFALPPAKCIGIIVALARQLATKSGNARREMAGQFLSLTLPTMRETRQASVVGEAAKKPVGLVA